jgi:hypothetical protein
MPSVSSHYRDHSHTKPPEQGFTPGLSPQSFASVVGTVDQESEAPIVGPSGDHLKFFIEIGGGVSYQVDVNTQSRDGSEIEVYVADENLNPVGTNASEPFGAPAFGVFPDARLSYQGLGLTDQEFIAISASRIESLLENALNQSTFVAVYGLVYDVGGPDGKGVHETHFDATRPNEDGAVAVYIQDPATGAPKRTWFFFKFAGDQIGGR